MLVSYLVFHHFHYVAAPGGDLFNHAEMMYALKNEGLKAFFDGYPKFFHLLLLGGVTLSGRDPLWVMLAYLPLVVAAAGLMAFFLLNRLKGPWIGLLALILAVFVARQPLQTLYDGGFPDFLSVAVWLPMVFLGVAVWEKGVDRRKGIVLMVLGALLVILTHHFSATYLGVLVLAGLFFVPPKIRWYLVWLLVIGLVLFVSPIGSGVRGLVSSILQVGGGFPWLHIVGHIDNPDAIIPLLGYPDYFSPLVLFGGLATALWVIWLFARGRRIPLTVTLLAVLAIVLLVCSQVDAFRFPLRLARDAGMPLLMLATYGIAELYVAARGKRLFRVMLILAVIATAFPDFQARVTRLFHFEPTMQFTPAQATMARRTNGQPAVYIDNQLVTVAYPNIGVVFPQTFLPKDREASVTNHGLVLVDIDNPHFLDYQSYFTEAGFYLVGEASDPIHRSRLYARQP